MYFEIFLLDDCIGVRSFMISNGIYMIDFDKYQCMVNVICFLVVDVVEQVKFGYLGLLMGVVDIVIVLFIEFMKFDFMVLYWLDWDWFVLLVGYGFMLLYSLFYFFGYDDFFFEEFKNFW